MTSQRCRIDGCDEKVYVSDRDGGLCRPHYDGEEAARRAEEKRVTEEAGGPWPQTCPRRMGEIGPWQRTEGEDRWDIRQQMHKGLRARHCSFCGSLHPEDFLRLVKEGWQVGATDKSYKAYLASPDGHGMETKFYFQHFSREEQQEFVDLYNERRIAFQGGHGFYCLPFFMKVVR